MVLKNPLHAMSFSEPSLVTHNYRISDIFAERVAEAGNDPEAQASCRSVIVTVFRVPFYM